MDIHQARTDSTQEDIKAKMDSYHEKLMTIMKASKEKIEAVREACLERRRPRIWSQVQKKECSSRSLRRSLRNRL
jgi:hypothetical protein